MTHLDFIAQWAQAFTLTLSVEAVICFVLLAAVESSKWRRMVIVLAGQLSTHPVVWFVLPGFSWPWWVYASVAEAWAWLFEALLYATVWQKLGWRRALLYSLFANAVSVGIGRLFLL